MSNKEVKSWLEEAQKIHKEEKMSKEDALDEAYRRTNKGAGKNKKAPR